MWHRYNKYELLVTKVIFLIFKWYNILNVRTFTVPCLLLTLVLKIERRREGITALHLPAPSQRSANNKNKQGVPSCTWKFGLAKWSKRGTWKTLVALYSCCYSCLGYSSQVFFCAISTSLENMKKLKSTSSLENKLWFLCLVSLQSCSFAPPPVTSLPLHLPYSRLLTRLLI